MHTKRPPIIYLCIFMWILNNFLFSENFWSIFNFFGCFALKLCILGATRNDPMTFLNFYNKALWSNPIVYREIPILEGNKRYAGRLYCIRIGNHDLLIAKVVSIYVFSHNFPKKYSTRSFINKRIAHQTNIISCEPLSLSIRSSFVLLVRYCAVGI